MTNNSTERGKVSFSGNENITRDNSAERNYRPFTRTLVEGSIELGVDFIMSHFLPEERQLWPRSISTKKTNNAQFQVNSTNEMVSWFKYANLYDCKINAYPVYTDFYIKRTGIAPSLIFIDLDLGMFGFNKSRLDRELRRTLKNIRTAFGDTDEEYEICPTIIWSGNGYHIYLPVNAIPLEHEPRFYSLTNEPSRKFLQFAEEHLSNKKSDPCHIRATSFKNCMLRVPYSLNSKNDNEELVTIIQEWNGYRPSIRPLMYRFYLYLLVQRSDELHNRRKKKYQVYSSSTDWGVSTS